MPTQVRQRMERTCSATRSNCDGVGISRPQDKRNRDDFGVTGPAVHGRDVGGCMVVIDVNVRLSS